MELQDVTQDVLQRCHGVPGGVGRRRTKLHLWKCFGAIHCQASGPDLRDLRNTACFGLKCPTPLISQDNNTVRSHRLEPGLAALSALYASEQSVYRLRKWAEEKKVKHGEVEKRKEWQNGGGRAGEKARETW